MEDDERLIVAGVNFRKSSVEIRNRFAFTTEAIKRTYAEYHCDYLKDFFILSTCNRTEIYSTTSNAELLLNLLAHENGILLRDLKTYSYIKSEEEAMRHLFRVAAGLDSQILGDYEITGQLKRAFQEAKSSNKTSGYMEKLYNVSLQVSKQIKNTTNISDGTTSVSYAAIQQLKASNKDGLPLNICLLGLGKMGMLTLKNLKHYLPQHKITVINRNESKSQSAAEEFKVAVAAFDKQHDALQQADILIVATGADHPVVTKNHIETSRIKLIFDLSVPSNVSNDVQQLPDIRVLDIDELSSIVNQTLEQRMNQLPMAEKIISEHIEEFKKWETRRDQYREKNFTNLTQTISDPIKNNKNCHADERSCPLASGCCKN